MSVAESWNTLKKVFFRLCPDAPDLFLPGANPDNFNKLAAYFSEIPAEFCELWSINNGEAFESRIHPIPGFAIQSIDQIFLRQEGMNTIAQEMDDDQSSDIEANVIPEDAAKNDYYNLKYFIFADNSAGDSLVIDLDPGIRGKTGQITHAFNYKEDRYVISENLEEFLNLLVDVYQDRRMTTISAGGIMTPAWLDGDNPPITSLLDMLPILYKEGKLYNPE
jgi:cell wall assembly regulator SMI1